MGFETSAYVLGGFLLVFGFFFWFLSFREPAPDREPRGLRRLVQPKLVLALFGLLYVALAHYSVYAALVYGIEFTNQSECENVVSNSTHSFVTNVTLYEYVDTCANRTVPEGTTALFTIYSWVLFIDLFALVLGAMGLFFRWMARW